jgi:eukaryotic-like serine/threonine-protein kinase
MTSSWNDETGIGADRSAGESPGAIPDGTTIGVYRVDGVLGQGGMGVVYRATDTKLRRPVALKFLSTTLGDPNARRRFQQEAETASSLNHPHIVTVYDVGEHDGSQYIVSELVEGGTLEDLVKSRRLRTWRQSVELLIGVADAIAAAHSAGVLHRDIKPANILIDANGYAKLADFGLAKLLERRAGAAEDALSAAGVVAGTVAYMSPEQATGQPLDARSDVFSFGIVLYETLAGRRPFDATNDLELLKTIVHGAPAPLPSDVPDVLRNAVERALEKDPADRYQSMRDFVSDLRRLARRTATSTQQTVAPSRPARFGWPIVAGLAAVLSAGAAGTWYWQHRAPAEFPSALRESSSAATGGPPSIAVLPFVNISADPEQEYFSDGLSVELINQLTQIKGLQVTARASAFAFKGRSEDLRSVAKTLGVANILEGSVRKSGGRIRVDVQLVKAADGYTIWSANFEEKLDDVFAIQDKIALAVAAKLGPTLGVSPRSTDYGGTTSFAAYDHLLRGEALFGKADSMSAAIDEYDKALAIDPAYARASAEKAIALSAFVTGSPPSPGRDRLERERNDAAQRAIDSAPSAPLTLVAKMWRDADRGAWLEGDEACAAVFTAALDPRAEWICAGFLSVTGRVRSALPYREAARRADPLSMNVSGTLARQYAFLEMGEELAREFSRADQLSGGRWSVDEAMLAYLMHRGAAPGEVAEQLERACGNPEIAAPCMIWLQAVRAPEGARAILREQLDFVRKSYPIAAGDIALFAAYVGDRELAIDALQVFTGAPGASAAQQTIWYPLLGDERKDPRFKEIVRKLGLVDLWRQTARWGDFCQPLGNDDFECF